jgi:hypothetical protein
MLLQPTILDCNVTAMIMSKAPNRIESGLDLTPASIFHLVGTAKVGTADHIHFDGVVVSDMMQLIYLKQKCYRVRESQITIVVWFMKEANSCTHTSVYVWYEWKIIVKRTLCL